MPELSSILPSIATTLIHFPFLKGSFNTNRDLAVSSLPQKGLSEL
jgi:hypothetical protein